MTPPLVLASTSRYRRALLERLGLAVTCVAPDFDEDAARPSLAHLPLSEQALRLAEGKAAAVARLHPEALVIGGDQIAALGDAVLHKPGTAARAEAQLARLAGQTHQLYTAVVVMQGESGKRASAVDVHHMAMRPLSVEAIARYVAQDAPLDCAGSYRVESLGIALFERLAGDDFTAVVGLPLTRLVALLAEFGVAVP
jgi:septum formation protein